MNSTWKFFYLKLKAIGWCSWSLIISTSKTVMIRFNQKTNKQTKKTTNCKVCKQITNLSSNYQLLSVMAIITKDTKERRIKFIKRKFVVYQVIYNLDEQKYIYIWKLQYVFFPVSLLTFHRPPFIITKCMYKFYHLNTM